MLYIAYAVALTLGVPLAYLCASVFVYFYDAKGLRRFDSLRFLSGVTDLPWVWASIRGRRYKDLHAAHARAAIIRVAPNVLSFNDLKAAVTIYGHGSPAVKAPYYDAGAGHFKNVADTRDKEEHSRKRRLLASGYALTTLIRWEHKVASRIQALLDQYDSHCLSATEQYGPETVSVDHRRWMDIFTIDTIHDIGLSANLKLVEQGDDLLEVENSRGQTYQCHFRKSLWRFVPLLFISTSLDK